MSPQTTSHILMIRPVAFGFNEQTAANNHYQTPAEEAEAEGIQKRALAEFDVTVQKLREAGVHVTVVEDTPIPHTPDSIFPNNWVSFHEDGTVILYPMFAPNRRQERSMDVIEELKKTGCQVSQVIDMSGSENEGRFLEGTGSMVLDRANRIAYACLSERTHPDVLAMWAAQTGYRTVTFDAVQDVNGEPMPIYHTNVMMSVGTDLAIVCADAVRDNFQREQLLASLADTGKHIVTITEEQKNHFAGNMLEVSDSKGNPVMVMSTQAHNSLDANQLGRISTFCSIVHSDISTIETYGGGSARCMMAEVFLPSEP
jgi:hypothetical protein